jgi:hypothetical protein
MIFFLLKNLIHVIAFSFWVVLRSGVPVSGGVSFGRILTIGFRMPSPISLSEVVNFQCQLLIHILKPILLMRFLKQNQMQFLIYAGHNEYYGALGVGSIENGGNVRGLKN